MNMWRRVLVCLLGLVLLPVFAFGAGLVWLRSSSGEAWLSEEGVSALNAALAGSGLSCSAESLSGSLPESLEVRGFTLRDAQGPWLTVERASVRLILGAALHGQIQVQDVRVDAPVLLRLPVLPPAEEAPSDPDPLAFTRDLPPWLPLLRVDTLSVRGLRLPAALLYGEAASGSLTFDIDGSLAVPVYTELSTTLHVRRADAPGTDVRLAATLHTLARTLRLKLDARDAFTAATSTAAAPGLLQPFMPDWPLGELTLSFEGDAPLADWNGTVRVGVGGLGNVSGFLGFSLQADAPVLRGVALNLIARPDVKTSSEKSEEKTAEASENKSAPWVGLLANAALDLRVALAPGIAEVQECRLALPVAGASLTTFDVRVQETSPEGNATLAGRVRVDVQHPEALASALSLPPETVPFSAAGANLALDGTLFTPAAALWVSLKNLRTDSTTAPIPEFRATCELRLDDTGRLTVTTGAGAADLAALSLTSDVSGPPLAAYARSGHVPEVSLALLPMLSVHSLLTLDVPRPGALLPILEGSPAMHLHVQAETRGTAGDGAGDGTAAATVVDTAGADREATFILTLPAIQIAGEALSDLKIEAALGFPATFPQSGFPRLRAAASVNTSAGPATLDLDGEIPVTVAADADAPPDTLPRLSVTGLTLRSLGARVAGVRLAGNLDVQGLSADHPTLDGALTLNVDDMAALSELLPVPVQIASAQATVRLRPEAGQSAELSAELRGLTLPEPQLSLSGLNLQVSARDLFAAPVLEGTLNVGEGTAPGAQWKDAVATLSAKLADAPTLNLKLAVADIVPDGLGSAPPLRVDLTGQLQNLAFVCGLTAEGLGLEPFSGEVRVPVRLTDGIPQPDFNAPLSGFLRWKGQLTPLWRLVPVANCRVRGTADIDLRLEGTLAAPRPSGGVLLEDVLFQDLAQALELSHMRADLRYAADGTATLRASGDGARGGNFAFTGGVGPAEAGFPLNISGTFDKLAPLLRRDLRFSLSGTMAVSGTPAAPDVRAALTVDGGELLIENLPGSGVTTLNVEEGDAEPVPPPAVGSLDVTVTIPGKFYVRGHGIESEWGGKLGVTGPFTAPIIAGSIASVRGTFSALGKLFILTKGEVSFDGGSPPKPVLDVRLSYARSGFTALIELMGPATKPRLKLSSQPPLPQDEIVSRILFGSSVGDLSRGEAIQLAATVASLTFFGTQGGGILDLTRQTFGLDVLRFGSSRLATVRPQPLTSFGNIGLGPGQVKADGVENPGDIAVEAGKYILDNVYVGLEQGMEENSSGVVVDIEVSPGVNLEARTNGKGTEVGVSWSWDY